MKKASIILSHLAQKPQFRYLKQGGCYKKYISLLSAKWQKAIAFVYIRENTLFVALTHPGFKMELNYNKDLLISLLKQLSTFDEKCKILSATKVVIFLSKYKSLKKSEAPVITVPYYDELATPNFDIKSKDEELKKRFKQIQNIIKEQLK